MSEKMPEAQMPPIIGRLNFLVGIARFFFYCFLLLFVVTSCATLSCTSTQQDKRATEGNIQRVVPPPREWQLVWRRPQNAEAHYLEPTNDPVRIGSWTLEEKLFDVYCVDDRESNTVTICKFRWGWPDKYGSWTNEDLAFGGSWYLEEVRPDYFVGWIKGTPSGSEKVIKLIAEK